MLRLESFKSGLRRHLEMGAHEVLNNDGTDELYDLCKRVFGVALPAELDAPTLVLCYVEVAVDVLLTVEL